jgi:hypothetical protein
MQLFHFPDVSSCSHSTEQLHPVDPPNRSAVMRSVRPHAGTNSSPTDSIVIKAEMRGGVYCTNVLINSCRGRWRPRASRRRLRSTRAISKAHLWFEGMDRYLRPIDSRIHPMAQSIHKTDAADCLQGALAKMRARGAVCMISRRLVFIAKRLWTRFSFPASLVLQEAAARHIGSRYEVGLT